MSDNYLSAIDHEIERLTIQRQFYAEELAKFQRLSDDLDL